MRGWLLVAGHACHHLIGNTKNMENGLETMQVYATRYADDSMFTMWRDGAWWVCDATVGGVHVCMRYMDYTKKETLTKFRSLLRDKAQRPALLWRDNYQVTHKT